MGYGYAVCDYPKFINFCGTNFADGRKKKISQELNFADGQNDAF